MEKTSMVKENPSHLIELAIKKAIDTKIIPELDENSIEEIKMFVIKENLFFQPNSNSDEEKEQSQFMNQICHHETCIDEETNAKENITKENVIEPITQEEAVTSNDIAFSPSTPEIRKSAPKLEFPKLVFPSLVFSARKPSPVFTSNNTSSESFSKQEVVITPVNPLFQSQSLSEELDSISQSSSSLNEIKGEETIYEDKPKEIKYKDEESEAISLDEPVAQVEEGEDNLLEPMCEDKLDEEIKCKDEESEIISSREPVAQVKEGGDNLLEPIAPMCEDKLEEIKHKDTEFKVVISLREPDTQVKGGEDSLLEPIRFPIYEDKLEEGIKYRDEESEAISLREPATQVKGEDSLLEPIAPMCEDKLDEEIKYKDEVYEVISSREPVTQVKGGEDSLLEPNITICEDKPKEVKHRGEKSEAISLREPATQVKGEDSLLEPIYEDKPKEEIKHRDDVESKAISLGEPVTQVKGDTKLNEEISSTEGTEQQMIQNAENPMCFQLLETECEVPLSSHSEMDTEKLVEVPEFNDKLCRASEDATTAFKIPENSEIENKEEQYLLNERMEEPINDWVSNTEQMSIDETPETRKEDIPQALVSIQEQMETFISVMDDKELNTILDNSFNLQIIEYKTPLSIIDFISKHPFENKVVDTPSVELRPSDPITDTQILLPIEEREQLVLRDDREQEISSNLLTPVEDTTKVEIPATLPQIQIQEINSQVQETNFRIQENNSEFLISETPISPCAKDTEELAKDSTREKNTLANIFDDMDTSGISLHEIFSYFETKDDNPIPTLEIPEELIALPDTTKVVLEKAKGTISNDLPAISRKRKLVNDNICKWEKIKPKKKPMKLLHPSLGKQ